MQIENIELSNNNSFNSSTTTLTLNQSDQLASIDLIIKKLGHDLEEIRLRSLDNLISKLESKIISENDLCHNKQLFIKLFDLFNFENFNQHEKVLSLLLSLSINKSACKNIIDINGINLLTSLKSNLSKNEKLTQLIEKLDKLIENLLEQNNPDLSKLSIKTATNGSSNKTNNSNDSKLIQSQLFINNEQNNEFDQNSHASSVRSNLNQINQFNNQQDNLFIPNDQISNHLTSDSSIPISTTASTFTFENFKKQTENSKNSIERSSINNLTTSSYNSKYQQSISINSNDLSYTTRNAFINNENKIMLNSYNDLPDVNKSTFYWLPLTQMDKQFLTTAENSLKSNDAKKIKSYCTFLQAIVFNDFPAEIFLQRSSILKILIDLVTKSTILNQESLNDNSKIEEDNSGLLKSLLECFHYYCCKLKKRIIYVKDPGTFCYKDFYSNGHDYFSKSIYFKKLTKIDSSRTSANLSSINSKPASINKDCNLNTSLYSLACDNNSVSNISSIKSSSASSKTLGSNSATTLNSNKNKKANTVQSKPGNPKLKTSQSQGSFPNNNSKPLANKTNKNENTTPRFSLDENRIHLENNEISEEFEDLKNSIEICLSETQVENYETDLNQMNDIRRAQEWPVYMFCFKLLDCLIDNLNLILIKNNKPNQNHQLNTSLLPLINETINNLIDILYETRSEWNVSSLNEFFMSLFNKINLNIKYALNLNLNQSEKNLLLLNISNRLIYIYLVNLFFKIIKLIYSTEETSVLMPAELAETLFIILNDICLLESFKSFNMVFSTILINLDKTLYDIYSLSNEICESMKSACEFMTKYNQTNLKEELIQMAKKSLNYMDYHACIELAKNIVEFSSKIMSSDKELSDGIKSDIEYLITSCMISKCEEIKVETYSTIYRIVHESLNVQVATEVNSKRYKGINFLLLNKVFYQYITFGLFDKSTQVKKLCEKILVHLLQCELLVPEYFRLKLTQLIVIYMPFIQCFASQVETLGQCIIKMSDDLLTPTINSSNSKLTEEALKLFLSPAIERLRCSMRYLYSKDKSLRKKGYQQTIGFLSRYHRMNNNKLDQQDDDLLSTSNRQFNINDFYLKFLPDKFCDLVTKLKKKNRTFIQNNYETSNNQYTVSIFQTDNLLRIYNIFTSEQVDLDVKQNAGEQLCIMLSTGDLRLHKAFINLDGINYCLRYLKNNFLKLNNSNKFLSNIEKDSLNKLDSICINCLSNIFYWNKDIRQLYLFDIEIYRLIIKCLIICFKQFENESNLYFNPQEDLSIVLFILLYHQVSCLDYYYQENENNKTNKFDLSLNLKEFLLIPFNISYNNNNNNNMNMNNRNQQFEIKQLEKEQNKTYELNYKLNSMIKLKLQNYSQERTLNLSKVNDQFYFNLESNIVYLLDKKFRLYWNFKWHGGSLLKLCNDLINNEQFVTKFSSNENDKTNKLFSDKLILNENDKFLVKYTSPIYFFKQLTNSLNNCSSHQEALNILDLIEVLISIVNDSKDLDMNEVNRNEDEYDLEFYTKTSLAYYFNQQKCDWHLSLNRFTSVLPSNKSKMDQLLYSSSFRTIHKMLDLQTRLFDEHYLDSKSLALLNDDDANLLTLDKWLFNTIYDPSSCLLIMIKNLLINYEQDETRINSCLMPLCEFVKVFFNRLSLKPSNKTCLTSDQFKLPSFELLKICIIQMQECEIEKFRNLNKLAVLINLIGSLLRASFDYTSTNLNNHKIYVQLIKSLVQIINIFNIGRGGLSLSFMGNYITKSAHVSLLQIIKNLLSSPNMNQIQKNEIIRAVLCLKDEKNNLNGSSWLIPLMLHREPQIRSISFCLISLLASVPYARLKLMVNQTNIWSIGLNVLLNPYESSIVRTQACSFLINLTQSINYNNYQSENNDESSITVETLKLLLEEFNFYKQIAFVLSTFYPFETYSFNELLEQNSDKSEIISICSADLVTSICLLLYNLNIILNKEAIMMINNNSIFSLLVSYVKPINLLSSTGLPTSNIFDNKKAETNNLNTDLIEMLIMICKYLNLCCQMNQNCILMLLNLKNQNIIYDLIECLNISNKSNRSKLKPFYIVLFELLITFLNYYEDKETIEICLILISKCWQILTNFILNDILSNDIEAENDLLYENSLRFYSIYLSKLTQYVNSNSSNNLKILFDNILYLLDNNTNEENSEQDLTYGALLAKKIIKQFDKYFLIDTNQSLKLNISNMMKCLFVLSNKSKKVAYESGLIESLIEHLKYTNSKLNLKSLSLTKIQLKDNYLIFDLQQCLLILKYLMCNNLEIKETVTKSGLHAIIHSFWCWALQDFNLLKSTLSTLCTLTANNKLAINQIIQTNINAQTTNAVNEPRLLSNSSSSSNLIAGLSLLHSIIKTLQKSLVNTNSSNNKTNFLIQKYSFSILTNCAQSNECKNLIWKLNLIQDFTQIDFQTLKLNSSKFQFKLEKLWLNFLVSLSFSQDGQQFFMKIDSLLSIIIKFLDPLFFNQTLIQYQQQQQDQIQYLCLLILRNLTFNQSNKSKLISNSDCINTLIQNLKSKNEKFQILALSALDSLLYDYQKAKVILKNANALKYLVDLHDTYSRLNKKKQDNSNGVRILSIVNNLIKILND